VSDERVENKPNCWTCVYCGFHYFHSEIELAEVVCKCGKGMGRWKVDYVAGVDGGARPDHDFEFSRKYRPLAEQLFDNHIGKPAIFKEAAEDYRRKVIEGMLAFAVEVATGGARELEQEDSPAIKSLRDRCEANVVSFSNDDVSELLVEIDRLRLAMERKAGR
jgi:hypothetical protein